MTKDNKQKDDNNSLLGKVAVGAAVIGGAALTAKVLSDKDNREKLADGVKQAGEKGKELVENLREKGSEVVDKLQAKGNEVYDKLNAEYEEMKGNVDKVTKDQQNSAEYKKLKKDVDSLADKLRELKAKGQDSAEDIIADIKSLMGRTQKEYKTMQSNVA